MTPATLTVMDLLDAWDECAALTPLRRAVALAARASGVSGDDVERLSVGARDALLLDLRARAFGKRIPLLANCPACGTAVEGALSSDDLPGLVSQSRERVIEKDGRRIWFRLPDSADLAAVEGMRDAAQVRSRLLENCLLREPVDAFSTPEIDAVIEAMSQADPLAAMEVALDCPNCDHHWPAPFDIVSFLWAELNAWARRVLYEVHALASAYGWTEREVLSLSPLRRRMYLEMAANG